MKSVKIVTALLLFLALSTLALLSSCKKENSTTGNQQVAVYLTDGPVQFDAVNIDIRAVEVKVDSSEGHMHDDHFGDMDDDHDDSLHHEDSFGTWVTLNFTPGIYNVAQLRNGLETLLASGAINGTVRKIRLTLGTNNTVVVNGTSYPLTLINPTGNFLYIHVNERHHEQNGNQLAIWIDFDLGRSIRLINGNYYLLPVLRPFCNRNFAELEGKVLPAAANAVVTVYNSSDTAVAIPNRDGYFKVRGLTSGTYSVLFDGQAPYIDTTITNVNLTAGREVHLQPVTLRQ